MEESKEVGQQEALEALLAIPAALEQMMKVTDDRFAHVYRTLGNVTGALRTLIAQNEALLRRIEALEARHA